MEKIRVLVGLKTDRPAYDLIQRANEQQELSLKSHADAKQQVSEEVLQELEKSHDSSEIQTGVEKFVEWVESKKLEVKAYPTENIHSKVYIMTSREGDRDAGRVITGSSNFSSKGLQHNLEFNVELKNRSDYNFAIISSTESYNGAGVCVAVGQAEIDCPMNRYVAINVSNLRISAGLAASGSARS